uniref:Anamorsin homolog n=1 Tax=Timspurckia oligopyrenoides TaxID=708627 RepID=A0A7S0ZAN9_9RHOD
MSFEESVVVSDAQVNSIVEKLKQGAKVSFCGLNKESVDSLKLKLLIAGFVESVYNPETLILSAKRPGYHNGSSVAVALDGIESEDDLVDEEDLMPSSELRVEGGQVECGPNGATSGRKACKDCSCGLAEKLDAERTSQVAAAAAAPAKSSCGSCYLGDAFRCASCPYLGMPPFKPGEKVQISSNLLTSDL